MVRRLHSSNATLKAQNQSLKLENARLDQRLAELREIPPPSPPVDSGDMSHNNSSLLKNLELLTLENKQLKVRVDELSKQQASPFERAVADSMSSDDTPVMTEESHLAFEKYHKWVQEAFPNSQGLMLHILKLISETMLHLQQVPTSVSDSTEVTFDDETGKCEVTGDPEALLIWRQPSGRWVRAIVTDSQIHVVKQHDFNTYVYSSPSPKKIAEIAFDIASFLNPAEIKDTSATKSLDFEKSPGTKSSE